MKPFQNPRSATVKGLGKLATITLFAQLSPDFGDLVDWLLITEDRQYVRMTFVLQGENKSLMRIKLISLKVYRLVVLRIPIAIVAFEERIQKPSCQANQWQLEWIV